MHAQTELCRVRTCTVWTVSAPKDQTGQTCRQGASNIGCARGVGHGNGMLTFKRTESGLWTCAGVVHTCMDCQGRQGVLSFLVVFTSVCLMFKMDCLASLACCTLCIRCWLGIVVNRRVNAVTLAAFMTRVEIASFRPTVRHSEYWLRACVVLASGPTVVCNVVSKY